MSAFATDYALHVAKITIDFFENFYKIKYPLGKLHLIAINDFSAGAMVVINCKEKKAKKRTKRKTNKPINNLKKNKQANKQPNNQTNKQNQKTKTK